MRSKVRIRKIKTAFSGMNEKKNALIELKDKLDTINRGLKKKIRNMSSFSHEEKDEDFYIRLDSYKKQIEVNLATVTQYRHSIHRLKESIKNRNRHLSNGEKI